MSYPPIPDALPVDAVREDLVSFLESRITELQTRGNELIEEARQARRERDEHAAGEAHWRRVALSLRQHVQHTPAHDDPFRWFRT